MTSSSSRPRREPDWREEALCLGADQNMFFPEQGEPAFSAKRLCLNCPVQSQCREYALDRREPHGIWGGMTPRERRKAWRRNAKPTP